MSDILEDIANYSGDSGDSIVLRSRAADEIERLRGELASEKARIQSIVKRGTEWQRVKIDELRVANHKFEAMLAEKDKRIEELELDLNQRDRIIDKREFHIKMLIEKNGHIITDEQIDKAWDGGRRPPTEYSDGFDAALGFFGIVPCSKCGGSGMQTRSCPTDKWPNSEVASDCPTCHGHGWVKEEKCGG